MVVEKNTSLVKKMGISVGVIFGLLLLAAIVIPFIVDVDQYRPQIVDIANDNLDGKLKIGRLSLSLWGQVEIDVDGVELEDKEGNKLVSVKETYAQISFLSILKGQPRLVFRMVEPNLDIVKFKNGKMNILGLMKESATTTPAPTPQPKDKPKKDAGEPAEIPAIAIIAAAGIDVELRQANLKFRDLSSGFVQDVNDFNILLEDISMSRPMNLKIWADIETAVGEDLNVKGPFKITGKIEPQFEGVDFKSVMIDMNMNFDKIVVDMGEAFQKQKGVPANIDLSMTATTSVVDVQKVLVNFHNTAFEAHAKLTGLETPDPVLNFDLLSKPIELAKWSELISALKEFELEGRMDIGVKASGPFSKIDYQANLDIIDIVAKAPGLLARPKMQLNVDVITNQVKLLAFAFEAPGTEIKLKAKLKDFSAPHIDLQINSKGIDLDQLLPKPKEEKTKTVAKSGGKAGKAVEGGGKSNVAAEPAADIDKSLEPIRNNEFIKSIVANVAVRVDKFKGFNVDAQNIFLDFEFKNMIAAIKKFNVNVFRGLIKANADVDLKPESPIYKMNLKIANLDLKTATESQMESLRDTILGRLTMNAQGSGQSLNGDKILKNLNLKGNFKIDKAEFATVDVGKMVAGGVNEGIKGITAKVPPLKDKTVKTPNSFRSRYETIKSDFSLKNGIFKAPHFATVAIKKEGIDLKGYTEADLLGDKLTANWLVIDTYNVTKARDVSVNVNGFKVDHILAKGKNPVSFPVEVGCKLSEPCYKYGAVPKYLGEIALNNVRGAIGKSSKKAVKKAKKEVKKKLAKQKKKSKKKVKKQVEKEKKKLLKKWGL